MKHIEIFTMATGPYVAYLNNFLSSVENFFPNDDKYVRVYVDTDNYREIEKLAEEKYGDLPQTDVEVYSLLDLPFPLIPLQKTFLINKFADKYCDYVFWFDIDTIFLRKEDSYWDAFYKKLDNNIVVSKHPHYRNNLRYISALLESNPSSEAFIPTTYHDRIMSSFWGGNYNLMIELAKRVNQMFANDLKNIRYLPKYVDENYIDKVIWEERQSDNPTIPFLYDDILIRLINWDRYNIFDDVFVIQKYDTKIKELRKQAMDLK